MKYLCICAVVLSALAGCDASPNGEAASTSNPVATNNKPTPPVLREGYYSFEGLPQEKIHYEQKNDLALFQGDIVLQGVNSKKTTTGLVGTTISLWDNNGTVAYNMREMPASLKENWLAAIQHIALRSNVRFSRDQNLYQRTTSAGTVYDYINVIENKDFAGGYSSVGRVGNGPQNLGLSLGVQPGLIAHEVLHALGHWHEQSRADRDNFIRVNPQNIDAEHLHNFDIHSTIAQMQGIYDYCSIMHYFPTAFSTNGQPSIEPLRPFSCMVMGMDNVTRAYTTFGQRDGLSPGDTEAITNRYSTAPASRPFAFAGFDQIVTSMIPGASSVSVTLDASRSFPVDGGRLTYTWMAFNERGCSAPGPGCTLALQSINSSSPRLTVQHPLPKKAGWTVIRRHFYRNYVLTVTDWAGRSASDVVRIDAFGS